MAGRNSISAIPGSGFCAGGVAPKDVPFNSTGSICCKGGLPIRFRVGQRCMFAGWCHFGNFSKFRAFVFFLWILHSLVALFFCYWRCLLQLTVLAIAFGGLRGGHVMPGASFLKMCAQRMAQSYGYLIESTSGFISVLTPGFVYSLGRLCGLQHVFASTLSFFVARSSGFDLQYNCSRTWRQSESRRILPPLP